MQKNTGRQLKEQGQQLALFNAGQEWTANIIERLKTFCEARKAAGKPEFRLEEFRAEVSANLWLVPSSHKCWGALPRVAVKNNLIRSTGRYERATSAATHAHPVAVWRAL